MTCIKTGADVWLDSHQCVIHCDVFKVGSSVVLHHTGRAHWGYREHWQTNEGMQTYCDYILHDRDAGRNVEYLDGDANVIVIDSVYVDAKV